VFPVPVACTSVNNAGKQCGQYRYTVTPLKGQSTDHVLFAVSADQDLDSASPSASVAPPGAGDSKTDFLRFARHEYAIRVNPTPQIPANIIIVGPTSPRISTVLVTKGNNKESCLIAGPGVLGSPFSAVSLTQTQLVAGGQCVAHLTFDALGNVIDVETDPPCTVSTTPVSVNGEPLRDNRNPNGITHGNGTCTTYGPPIPSPARTICR
jgi:hypothetical protein